MIASDRKRNLVSRTSNRAQLRALIGKSFMWVVRRITSRVGMSTKKPQAQDYTESKEAPSAGIASRTKKPQVT